jgi:hypothetical protein
VGLANLGSESETCIGSRVHLVGVSTSFEKIFYRLPFNPPSLVRRIGPSEDSELEKHKPTLPSLPWISQTAEWIETRFGGDVKHP